MNIVLGVDVTDSHVLCGCYKKSGENFELLWVDKAEVKNKDVGAAVRAVKDRHQLKKAKLHMSVPDSQVQQFVLGNVNYHKPEVHQKLVQAHLMQHGNADFNDLAYDYTPCAKDQLWVVAMQKTQMYEYLKWSESLKLSLKELEPTICGLLRLLPKDHGKRFGMLWVRDGFWHFAVCHGVDVVLQKSRSFSEGEAGLIDWIKCNIQQYELHPSHQAVEDVYLLTESSQGYDIISNFTKPGLKITWINPGQFAVPGPEYLVTYGLAIKGR